MSDPMKCPKCDGPMPPSGRGRPRRFCSPKCTQDFWKEEQNRRARKGVVRCSLSELDEPNRRAVCSVHGAIQIYKATDKYSDGRTRIRWICSARIREGSRKSRKRYEQSEVRRITRMVWVYGLTRERATELLALKGSNCDLCGRETELHYDHDHDTMAFRGWLCSTCNTGLGKFDEDPAALRRAAEYLERSGVEQSGSSSGP